MDSDVPSRYANRKFQWYPHVNPTRWLPARRLYRFRTAFGSSITNAALPPRQPLLVTRMPTDSWPVVISGPTHASLGRGDAAVSVANVAKASAGRKEGDAASKPPRSATTVVAAVFRRRFDTMVVISA